MAVYTAIDDPEAYFQVKLYAGDSTNHALTFDGDTDMQPDAVWIKERDDAINHYLYDSVRGVADRLQVNIANAESDTDSTWFQSFDSDGFSIGSEDNINDTGDNYVAWCWKESATSGFDIVLYTGSGSARTLSHSLSAVPHVMIVKCRSAGHHWNMYHHGNTSAPETDYLQFNGTGATADDATYWNDTAPTSSVFSVGTQDETNENTETYLAYLFSEKQGFSKFGSYEGNGDVDGTFVYLGFRPAFVMVKPIDASDNWVMFDNKRPGYNSSVSPYLVYANENYAESTDDDQLELLSNGFKIRDAGNTVNRTSTFIYMAFAEAPFVNSNGVPCNAG